MNSYSKKLAAENAAKRVNGVKGVIDTIDINPTLKNAVEKADLLRALELRTGRSRKGGLVSSRRNAFCCALFSLPLKESMITFRFFEASPSLSSCINYYIVATVTDDNDLPASQEVYPITMTGLNFIQTPDLLQYRETDGLHSVPPTGLIGQMTEKKTVYFCKPGVIVTAVFTVTGLHRLFGIPMHEVTGGVFEGADVLRDPRLFVIRQEIFDNFSPDAAIAIIERHFNSRLHATKKNLRVMEDIVQYINDRKGDVDVDALTRHSNMSAKTLERHFAEKIGLNPKFFSRIVRFSHAMKMVEGQKNIFEIIDSCGYSDQAHLIREFKHFTGRTPVYGYVGLEEMPRLFLDNLGLDISA